MSDAVRQFRPVSELEHSVDAFWFHAGTAQDRRGDPVTVYPDGCIDLIFRARRRAGSVEHGRLFVAGASETPYSVAIGDGESFVGVRFRPGMSRIFVDADPSALLGRNVSAVDIDPVFVSLKARLAEAVTPAESLGVLGRAIAAAARANPERDAPARTRKAIALLRTLDSSVRVEAVAGAVGTSVRSLRRDLIDWTGLSPKLLSRIFRFQAALAMVRARPGESLTTIAHEAGYADHPHMTREFQALAGAKPSALQSRAGRAHGWPICSSQAPFDVV